MASMFTPNDDFTRFPPLLSNSNPLFGLKARTKRRCSVIPHDDSLNSSFLIPSTHPTRKVTPKIYDVFPNQPPYMSVRSPSSTPMPANIHRQLRDTNYILQNPNFRTSGQFFEPRATRLPKNPRIVSKNTDAPMPPSILSIGDCYDGLNFHSMPSEPLQGTVPMPSMPSMTPVPPIPPKSPVPSSIYSRIVETEPSSALSCTTDQMTSNFNSNAQSPPLLDLPLPSKIEELSPREPSLRSRSSNIDTKRSKQSLAITRKPVQSTSRKHKEKIVENTPDALSVQDGGDQDTDKSDTASFVSSVTAASIYRDAHIKKHRKSAQTISTIVHRRIEDNSHQEEVGNKKSLGATLDPFSFASPLLESAYEAIKIENLDVTKQIGWLIVKIIIVLYLASCLWNVLTAIHASILTGLEPIVKFLTFLHWLFGGSNML